MKNNCLGNSENFPLCVVRAVAACLSLQGSEFESRCTKRIIVVDNVGIIWIFWVLMFPQFHPTNFPHVSVPPLHILVQ